MSGPLYTFGLHRLPGVWAERTVGDELMPYAPGYESQLTGWQVQEGPPWAHLVLSLFGCEPGPYADWLTLLVSVSVDGWNLGRDRLPLSVYVGEPTDMPTGILRLPDPSLPGSLWMLTGRRSA